MNQIIPAILVHDEAAFVERLRIVEELAPIVQIDVMDGKFVPNVTWCGLEALKTIETKTTYELHLMVEDPDPVIREAVLVPKVARIVWHVESMGDHRELLAFCSSHGKEAGLALSPDTPADTLKAYEGRMDEILILGVKPGFSGQKLIFAAVEKARQLRVLHPDVPLAFDGGVTAETIPALRETGVTRFCAASAIFDTSDPKAAFRLLQSV
jgi:ribulose-phosphate 3-epimerase